jgi:beta-lactamase regulating signal transducer with metallopeptidase domain/tetratricopeptide (TPR) repeat protein
MNALASATRLASEVAVRATILFALTGFALLALRRAGAAARHRAATLGLAAGLVLPLLSLAVPHVPVRILSPVSSSVAAAPGRTAPLLLALWALGTLAVAARLAVGWSRVKRLSREAVVVWDAEWIAERDDAARRLAVQRTVSLKESDEVPVAITSGWRRPLLLVGRAARLWAVERRRIVLLHELAHVKRADWPALLVAEAAVALYWFHPLAIWLGRRVRREAEQACDELVIASGTKPSVYAGHLLGIFRSVGAPHPVAPALAIARPHAFEARLRAILDPRLPAGAAPGPGSRLALAGLLAASAAVVAIEPAATCPRGLATAGLRAAAPATHSVAAPKTPCTHNSRAAVQGVAERSSETTRRETREEFREVAADETESAKAPSDEIGTDENELPTLPEKGESRPAIWRVDGRSAPQAKTGFVLASNSHKNGRDGADWYDRGMKLHRRGKYAEAIEAFENAIADGYREDASSYNIACGYALLGNKDKAFEWLHKAIEEGFELSGYLKSDDDLEDLHGDPRWAELKAAARQARSNGEKAEERRVAARYDRLVARNPQSGEPYFDMGRELLRADLYEQAAQAFQTSAERDYRAGTSLYNEACARSLAGQKDAAIDLLQKSLAAGFDQPDIYEKDDDLDNVRNDPRFASIEKDAKDLALPSYNRGPFNWSSHSERKKWREAAPRLQAYADKHPQVGRAWYNLGFALLAGDRADEAAAPFQKALDLGYRKSATMYNLACTYARLDRKDTAFDWLFKALDAGFDETWTMRFDDDLDNLRGDSRYRKAVEIARHRDRSDEKD